MASPTALFITPAADADIIAPKVEALMAATFAPVMLQGPVTSALPAVDWPPRPTGITATGCPRMSVAESLAPGVDRESVLLPSTFHCHVTTEPRAVDPRPDIRLESLPDQRYALTRGTTTGTGTWYITPHDVFDTVLQFTGPLKACGDVTIGTSDGE